jgi:hypothetical protein
METENRVLAMPDTVHDFPRDGKSSWYSTRFPARRKIELVRYTIPRETENRVVTVHDSPRDGKSSWYNTRFPAGRKIELVQYTIPRETGNRVLFLRIVSESDSQRKKHVCCSLTYTFPFFFLDQLITNCFWDVAKNGSMQNPKGRWLKYTTRYVLHYVMDHILSIRASDPASDETALFTIDNFKRVLAKNCHSHRHQENDNSPVIVWRSSTRDLVSWNRAGPMIVKIPTTNNGPHLTPAEMPPDHYPLSRANIQLKDAFFQNIGCTHHKSVIQINHILIGRLILFALRDPTAGAQPMKKPIDYRIIERVSLGGGLFLTRFFTTQSHAEGSIHTVWKHYRENKLKWRKIKERAETNQLLWGNHGSDLIDILQTTAEDEALMDQRLSHADSFHCLKMAESGKITRKFLLWLLQMKEWYDNMRLGGTLPNAEDVREHCSILQPKSD